MPTAAPTADAGRESLASPPCRRPWRWGLPVGWGLPPDEVDNCQVIGGWRKHYNCRRRYVKGQSIQESRAQIKELGDTIVGCIAQREARVHGDSRLLTVRRTCPQGSRPTADSGPEGAEWCSLSVSLLQPTPTQRVWVCGLMQQYCLRHSLQPPSRDLSTV